MHPSSYLEMDLNIKRYLFSLPPKSLVVDIGSLDVNGSYRPLVEPFFKYLGLDLEPGLNVDMIMDSEFNTSLPDSYADAVISGQCLEHCRDPFALVKEIFRIVKKNSYVLLTAPWTFPIHRYPLDCWRILPDGMKILVDRAGGKFINSYIVETDCWGIGKSK